MSDNITIEVLRPLRWDGETRTRGATIKASALQAQQLLDTGRARLVHAADAEQCRQAVRADVLHQLKASGAGRIAPPPGPWQPL